MPHTRLTPLILVAVGAALIWPSAAAAQWRRPYPYPYPYGPGVELTGAVRIQVSPRSAEVFVDGYLAGVVDEFDGIFQRLRLPVGGHRLTIYLEGYRTLDRDVYLAPGGDLRIKLAMERLPPGETAEPPPSPEEVVVPEPPVGDPAGRQPREPLEPARAAPREFFGALSVRVTPADAEILVDGAPPDIIRRDGVVVIRLRAGEHDLAISREGYQTYTEKVLIQRGRTLSLSVTLKNEARLRFPSLALHWGLMPLGDALPLGGNELVALVVATSFAAGLNVYATVATLGLLARADAVVLPPMLDPLASWWVIGVCAVMFTLEFFADKVPAFDLLWNALHTFVRVPVGALLAYGATADLSPGWQLAATTMGATLAFAAHSGKTAMRAAVTPSPEPLSNTFLSLAEDAVAIFLVWFATEHPFIAAAIVVVFLVLLIFVARMVFRALRALYRGAFRPREA